MNETSPKYSLNKADAINLGKNALIVAVAAGLTFVGQNLANLDLGTAGTLVVPIVVLGIDAFVKFLKSNKA